MAQRETVVLTNMCMIYDHEGNVLVQDRLDPNWPGVTFPGGHVEAGEIGLPVSSNSLILPCGASGRWTGSLQ